MRQGKQKLLTINDVLATKEAAMSEKIKFPSKRIDAHKNKLVRVQKYHRQQKHGNPYYVEIVSTKRKIPVSNKKEGNVLRDYIWEYIIEFNKNHPYRRGRALEHEEQWYFDQGFCHEINNFVLEIKNGKTLIGKELNPLAPATSKTVFTAFTKLNQLLILTFPEKSLRDFFNPVKINSHLNRLKDADINKKHSYIRMALTNIHVFDNWMTEKVKRKITKKYGKGTDEEDYNLELLANRPLISPGTYSEISIFKKSLDKLKEIRPTPEFDSPQQFIEDLENNLDKLTTIPQLKVAISIILNTVLCFRQNEFCALRFSDFQETKSGGLKVQNFLRAVVSCKVEGKRLVPTNKTNTPLSRFLDPYFVKYINILKHPVFSRYKEQYLRQITLTTHSDGKKEFIIKERSGKKYSRRVPSEHSFLHCLQEFGFKIMSDHVFPKDVKGEFLLENSKNYNKVFYNSVTFHKMHGRVLAAMGIKFKSPHRRFRADPVTSRLKSHGLTLDNFQAVKNSMGWKSDAMVHNYINEIKRTDQEETSLIGTPKREEKEKKKLSLQDLTKEDKEELLRQVFELIDKKTSA